MGVPRDLRRCGLRRASNDGGPRPPASARAEICRLDLRDPARAQEFLFRAAFEGQSRHLSPFEFFTINQPLGTWGLCQMRILLCGIFHETHSFVPEVTGLEKFDIRRGAEL